MATERDGDGLGRWIGGMAARELVEERLFNAEAVIDDSEPKWMKSDGDGRTPGIQAICYALCYSALKTDRGGSSGTLNIHWCDVRYLVHCSESRRMKITE